MTAGQTTTGVRRVCVDKAHDGQRLDNFVTSQLPGVPRSVIYRVIRKGQVRINGGRAKPATRISEGDEIRIPPAQVNSNEPPRIPAWAIEEMQRSVIEADADFFVINKPAGMAVHGGSGLSWGVIDVLRHMHEGESLELVHRLDRETSGCLLVARNAIALRELRQVFSSRQAQKRYLCLTQSRMSEDLISVDEPLIKSERSGERIMQVHEEGKQAHTEFRLLEHYGPCSFVEALPTTGRTHQIRVHAQFLGLPLAGDQKYGDKSGLARDKNMGLKRLFLHAHSLGFSYPGDRHRQYSCALPEELSEMLNRFNNN